VTSRLESGLRRIRRDLDDLGVGWAVIGGLAVSARAEPRTTRDIDLAIAAPSDAEGEGLAASLVRRGYRIRDEGVLENLATGRLAALRLSPPGEPDEGVVVDRLFHSSGVEAELIDTAETIELFAGVLVPVARRGPLIALKLLAGRAQDIADARSLLRAASAGDVEETRETLELIRRRGCDRGRHLRDLLDRLLAGRGIEVM
jgi:hypothetical protein